MKISILDTAIGFQPLCSWSSLFHVGLFLNWGAAFMNMACSFVEKQHLPLHGALFLLEKQDGHCCLRMTASAGQQIKVRDDHNSKFSFPFGIRHCTMQFGRRTTYTRLHRVCEPECYWFGVVDCYRKWESLSFCLSVCLCALSSNM